MGHSQTGPRTAYRPKDPPNVTLYLTSAAKRRLASAARRARQSRSTVVEYLLREHAPDLRSEHVGHCRPKLRPNPCVSLTAVAKEALELAAARTGRARSDVVEALLEIHAERVSARDFRERTEAA